MFWDKQKYITVTVLALLLVGAWFSINSNTNSKTLDVSANCFAVIDSTAIKSIQLKNATNTVEISNKTGVWLVNGMYPASVLNVTRLLYILKNVTVKRELSISNAKEIIEKIQSNGTRVQVLGINGVIQDFIVDDGDITTSSCFYNTKNKKAYFVELPAFTDDFSKFITTETNHWRSKFLVNSSLKTLEEVTSNWQGKKVSLRFKNDFFVVDHVKDIDSNTVGMYLIQYRNLECDRFLDDSLKKLCSGSSKNAFASITIKDTDSTQNNILYFYQTPANKKQFMGYSTKLNECFWLDKNKTLDLLLESEQLFAKRTKN